MQVIAIETDMVVLGLMEEVEVKILKVQYLVG